MTSTEDDIEIKSLHNCSIGEFLTALSSDAMLPGAGAAAGVALALAAACAGKAVSITLKHINVTENAKHNDKVRLESLKEQFAHLASQAMALGKDDALLLKEALTSDKPSNASRLLNTDDNMLATCEALEALLDQEASLIATRMQGDWLAARALNQACRMIVLETIHDTEKLLQRKQEAID